MDYFLIITILVSLSALFGYINVKYIITHIDFRSILLDVMLSFLLFAGALHTNFEQLRIQRWPVLVFSTFGVLVSTFLVGTVMFYVLQIFGLQVAYIYCLLFGALISPTDPIAVLGILKKIGAPKKLETKIVGESLFNDGVGVVVFLTIFQIADSGADQIQVLDVIQLFGQEVIGGIALGALIGWVIYRLMKSIDDYDIEVIITLAGVMLGTTVAHHFHLSAPLAMVTAGLIVGNDTVTYWYGNVGAYDGEIILISGVDGYSYRTRLPLCILIGAYSLF